MFLRPCRLRVSLNKNKSRRNMFTIIEAIVNIFKCAIALALMFIVLFLFSYGLLTVMGGIVDRPQTECCSKVCK